MSETARPGAVGALVTADALRRFTHEVFVRAGMSAAHAGIVADVLVWADLRGVESHGVTRIPRYLEMIAAGDLDPAAEPTTRIESPASVVIDAARAAGPVAMTAAMAAAVRKAHEASIGLALVRQTTHTAALGYYTRAAARDGMAAIAAAASVPMMAYHGARAAGLATSPISIAVPGAEGAPLVLDMSTSAISVGRLLQAKRTGQAIPAGAALDAGGNPTADPRAAELPLPLGGAKGSGLSLMIECLASLIAGNAIIADALEGTPEGRRHRQNGMAVAIDIARFGRPASFQAEVRRLVASLKSLPHDPGVEILMPGERGHRTLEQRTREGIPVPRAVLDALSGVADRLGVAMVALA